MFSRVPNNPPPPRLLISKTLAIHKTVEQQKDINEFLSTLTLLKPLYQSNMLKKKYLCYFLTPSPNIPPPLLLLVFGKVSNPSPPPPPPPTIIRYSRVELEKNTFIAYLIIDRFHLLMPLLHT